MKYFKCLTVSVISLFMVLAMASAQIYSSQLAIDSLVSQTVNADAEDDDANLLSTSVMEEDLHIVTNVAAPIVYYQRIEHIFPRHLNLTPLLVLDDLTKPPLHS